MFSLYFKTHRKYIFTKRASTIQFSCLKEKICKALTYGNYSRYKLIKLSGHVYSTLYSITSHVQCTIPAHSILIIHSHVFCIKWWFNKLIKWLTVCFRCHRSLVECSFDDTLRPYWSWLSDTFHSVYYRYTSLLFIPFFFCGFMHERWIV